VLVIRKIYFIVQPIPFVGKFARYLNYGFRILLLRWIRRRSSSIELKAQSIISSVEISAHKEKFPKRDVNLSFPEAE
jgi:hypothetical protein